MTRAVIWLSEAMKAYRSLRATDPEGAKRVAHAIAALADESFPESSNPLGDTEFRRLRLDQYRVLYEVRADTVRVMHVGRVFAR
jgi:mRNA interferase RelE/StbE